MRRRAGEAATGYALRVIPSAIKPVPEEANETDQDLHLSTADDLKVGFHPWLNIRSARWLRFESAPTRGASCELSSEACDPAKRQTTWAPVPTRMCTVPTQVSVD